MVDVASALAVVADVEGEVLDSWQEYLKERIELDSWGRFHCERPFRYFVVVAFGLVVLDDPSFDADPFVFAD